MRVAALPGLAVPALFALAGPAMAAAEPPTCGEGGSPVVAVDFSETSFSPAFQERVLRDLRASLAPRGIAACPAAGSGGHRSAPGDPPASGRPVEDAPRAPIARVRVTAGADDRVGVSVDVADAITRKRVGRDVDVQDLPADGQALALAIAVDELLRASWAELAFPRGRSRPASDAPAEVTRLVEDGLAEERARRPVPNVLGVAFAFERYGTGALVFGGDAFLRRYLGPRVGLELGLGYRIGDEASSDRGAIDTRAFALGARLLVPLLDRRPGAFALELLAGLDARVVTFSGRGADGVEGAERTGLALFGRAGLRAGVGFGRVLRLELSGGLGVPVLGQNATDDRQVVTGLAELEAWAGLGFGFGLDG